MMIFSNGQINTHTRHLSLNFNMKYRPMMSIKYTGSPDPEKRMEAWGLSRRERERMRKVRERFKLSLLHVSFALFGIPQQNFYPVVLSHVLEAIPPFNLVWSRMLSAPTGRYIIYDWHESKAPYKIHCPQLLSLLREFADPILKLIKPSFKKHVHSYIALLGNAPGAPSQSTMHCDYLCPQHFAPHTPLCEMPLTVIVPLKGTRIIHVKHGEVTIPLHVPAGIQLCVYVCLRTLLSLSCICVGMMSMMNAIQPHYGGVNDTDKPQYALHIYLWCEGQSCPSNEITPEPVATSDEVDDLESELGADVNTSSSGTPSTTLRRSKRRK